MMNEEKMTAAYATLDTLCEMLEDIGLQYEKNEDDLSAICMFNDEEGSQVHHISVDAKRQRVSLYGMFCFGTVDAVMRDDVVTAISAINYQLANGNFVYNFDAERVYFRMTMSYRNSRLSTDAMQYLLLSAIGIIRRYAYDLRMLIKGKTTLEEFLENTD